MKTNKPESEAKYAFDITEKNKNFGDYLVEVQDGKDRKD